MLIRILLAMLFGGGFLTYYGCQEARLAASAQPDPQTISCADLAARGPGDNAHVILTDFMLCEFAYVYEAPEHGTSWSAVWIPAVPIDGEYVNLLASKVKPDGTIEGDVPMPTDIRVIVKSSEVRNEAAVTHLASAMTLQGMVINTVWSLGSEERKILSSSYPGVDFSNVYILEHGRAPRGAGFSYGMMGLGGLLSLSSVGLMAFRRASRPA